MQYKVPQFIEVEDKIFGPFTARQFSYLAGGAGLSIVVWRTFTGSSFLMFILAPVIAFSLALAFLKPNGKPFIFLVQHFLMYFFKPKKLFWKSPGIAESEENTRQVKKQKAIDDDKAVVVHRKIFSSAQIHGLSKNLDDN